jgi:2-oxoglutarate dehydrogenase E1 component
MDRFSFLNAAHTAFFADLYDQYLENPDSVEPSWRSFFQGFDFANEFASPVDQLNQISSGTIDNSQLSEKIQKEIKVLQLIEAYRVNGHLFSKTNPVRDRRTFTPTLDIENFGLNTNDLSTVFQASTLISTTALTLNDLVALLQKLFCQSIAFEYKYIRDPKTQAWIEQKINAMVNETPSDRKKIIVEKLNEAVSFENFLHTKYVGQKRFSLEGNEAVVPAFDLLIEDAAQLGVEQVVLGMAHRGRLNVLANVFDKSPKNIFSEFDGKDYADGDHFDGDVKYHLGITTHKTTRSGKAININLVPNPSHLETVGAVVEGITRSKQDRYFPNQPNKVLPVIVHGDAAVAGQGLVYEVAQMVTLDGYKTQGTIHVVINNQVGFTTNYTDSRSATYCTDIAKLTSAPVLHVNADDAEAVVKAMTFALEYRMEFGTDVFVDILGYRKYGHNEGDEPRFTQPKLYKTLSKHKNVRDIYGAKLVEQGVISSSYVKEIEDSYKAKLDNDLNASRAED